MTRSAQKAPSQRDQFTKSVRAKAHHEGLHFSAALQKVKAPADSEPRVFVIPGLRNSQSIRRNPGRNDEQWNSSQFISTPQVDDGDIDIHEEDVYDPTLDFSETHDIPAHKTDMTVSILDIAKPAKPKGVAKHFEVVRKPRDYADSEYDLVSNVSTQWLDDDVWEDIYEQTRDPQSSYSAAVLRGG